MYGNIARRGGEMDEPIADSGDGSRRRLFTLAKFAERHSSFLTLPAITNQVFKANTRYSSKGQIAGNGMLDHGVIVRLNRRVYIDEDAYFRWLDAQQDAR